MAAKGYTDKTAIQNYINDTIDASLDSQIDEWIEAVERIIDAKTNRNFKADSEASARLYSGDGSRDMIIDECVEITKVEVGNDDYGASFSEVASSGADRYFVEPENYSAKGLPIFKLILRARRFIEGVQNQRITAKWGFSASVPKDIKFAATVFVAGIYNQNRLESGEDIKSEKIGNYQVTYNTDKGENSWADFSRAMEILGRMKRIVI